MNKTVLGAFITSLLMASTGCGNYDPPQADPDEGEATSQEAISPLDGDGDEASAQLEDEQAPFCRTPATCSNSVSYARCRQPRLPNRSLRWYREKVAIINSSEASHGCVAVIDTRDAFGHLAYVERADRRTGIVYLSEGDWPDGRCGERSGHVRRLNIRGYWCPWKPH